LTQALNKHNAFATRPSTKILMLRRNDDEAQNGIYSGASR